MYKDHQYELISVYDNPTKQNSDSMASAFLGLEDREFVKPDGPTLAARALDLLDRAGVRNAVLRTNVGDIGLVLLRDVAPAAVRQFVRLARAGIYEGAHVATIQPGNSIVVQTRPLDDAQRANIYPLFAEAGEKHVPGAVSICPNEASFAIILGITTERDGRCTVFAKVGPGAKVVRTMSATPRTFDGAPQAEIRVSRVEIVDDPSAMAFIELAPAKPAGSMR
jgi:cyclophilin family peptidyl-prolyl cis-trans isomerase